MSLHMGYGTPLKTTAPSTASSSATTTDALHPTAQLRRKAAGLSIDVKRFAVHLFRGDLFPVRDTSHSERSRLVHRAAFGHA